MKIVVCKRYSSTCSRTKRKRDEERKNRDRGIQEQNEHGIFNKNASFKPKNVG